MPTDDDTPRERADGPAGRFEPLVWELLDQIAEVLRVRPLDAAERQDLLRLEDQAESTGAASGLIGFENEGVREALASDLVYAATTGPMHRDPPQPWTLMMDEQGTVIGEWLPESRIAEARESGRCIFLSEDFVMYKDRKAVGPSRFIMPFICLPVKEGSGVAVCGIGSPSGPADEYIRGLLGNPGREIATVLVGICLETDAESEREE